QKHPDISPGSIGWRMGQGEDYLLSFRPWFASLPPEDQKRFEQQHPEPRGWGGFYSGGRT
ncbi:MAG TPA: hypothetical protein VFS91_03400, partial [Nitrobacter sp.]|nr:hypothetical protein [Nitrobacter sp.]